MKDHLLKTLTRIEKKYGDLKDNDLGNHYEAGLNALKSEDKTTRILASEALIEWEKHHTEGHYR